MNILILGLIIVIIVIIILVWLSISKNQDKKIEVAGSPVDPALGAAIALNPTQVLTFFITKFFNGEITPSQIGVSSQSDSFDNLAINVSGSGKDYSYSATAVNNLISAYLSSQTQVTSNYVNASYDPVSNTVTTISNLNVILGEPIEIVLSIKALGIPASGTLTIDGLNFTTNVVSQYPLGIVVPSSINLTNSTVSWSSISASGFDFLDSVIAAIVSDVLNNNSTITNLLSNIMNTPNKYLATISSYLVALKKNAPTIITDLQALQQLLIDFDTIVMLDPAINSLLKADLAYIINNIGQLDSLLTYIYSPLDQSYVFRPAYSIYNGSIIAYPVNGLPTLTTAALLANWNPTSSFSYGNYFETYTYSAQNPTVSYNNALNAYNYVANASCNNEFRYLTLGYSSVVTNNNVANLIGNEINNCFIRINEGTEGGWVCYNYNTNQQYSCYS